MAQFTVTIPDGAMGLVEQLARAFRQDQDSPAEQVIGDWLDQNLMPGSLVGAVREYHQGQADRAAFAAEQTILQAYNPGEPV